MNRIGGGEAGSGAEAGLHVLVVNVLQYLVPMDRQPYDNLHKQIFVYII